MTMSATRRFDLRRAGTVLAVLCMAAFIFPACSGTSRRANGLPKVVRAGIAPIYPPLAYEKDGKLKGIEVDFADELDDDLGTEVKMVQLQWDELIPALQAGRIDVIMSGMSVTPERERLVSFADPYLQVGQMALIRRADYLQLYEEGRMSSPKSRVGFLKNTTSELFARENLPQAQLTGYATVDDGIAALRASQIDYFVMDAPGVWRITGGLQTPDPDLKGLYTPLTKEYLAWAVRKDDTVLRDRLNAVLAKWKANGELEEILDEWITVRKKTLEVRSHD